MIEGDAMERDDCAAIGDWTRTRSSSLVKEGEGLAVESGGLGCLSRLGSGDPPAADTCDRSGWSGTNDDGPTFVAVWEPS